MENQGRRRNNIDDLFSSSSLLDYSMASDYYLDDLFNYSSLPDYSMASDYGHFNSYFPSVNRRPTDSGYIAANNHHQLGITSYNSIPLESEFSRLSISTPENLQRMRAPSMNTGLDFSNMDPQNLNRLSNLYMDPRNTRRLSSYAYNYGITNSNLNRPRVYDYNRSDYEIGPWNSYPSFINRPISTNGLGTQSPRLSLRTSIVSSSLMELRGKITLVAKDQIGCRYLQNKFEEGNPEDIGLIYSELKDNICELMVHQFGNYLVQKFFEVCDEEQMNQLLSSLVKDERKFEYICTDNYGTRAVLKLLEYLRTPEQRSLVASVLRRITLALVKDNNGQRVIIYCLKHFSSEDTKHILNVVVDNCLDIAIDKSGCCVLQLCLTEFVGESRDRLIAKIMSDALFLSEDPYGNYVVQFILGLNIAHVTSDIMKKLSGNYVSLSMNKQGSNVVEKILKQSEGDEALPIVEELIRCPHSFLRVLQDPYGNYVAQSALVASRGPARQALYTLVNANYPFLHSHPHGKRVLARIKGLKLRQ